MTLKGRTRDPNTLRVQYLENYLSYRLQIWYAALYQECLAGAQIISLKVGVAYGTPTIFGSTVGYPSDSLAWLLVFLEVRANSTMQLCYGNSFKERNNQDYIICIEIIPFILCAKNF